MKQSRRKTLFDPNSNRRRNTPVRQATCHAVDGIVPRCADHYSPVDANGRFSPVESALQHCSSGPVNGMEVHGSGGGHILHEFARWRCGDVERTRTCKRRGSVAPRYARMMMVTVTFYC